MRITLQWRHNGRDGVSNRPRLDYLLSRLFRLRSKKTSKLRVTGEGNSPLTGEFPAQRGSNMDNVSIWWRHHDLRPLAESLWYPRRQLAMGDVRNYITNIRYVPASCKPALSVGKWHLIIFTKTMGFNYPCCSNLNDNSANPLLFGSVGMLE